MIYDYLLNKVVLCDGRVYFGIVDYATSKQLYFFDFTYETKLDYTLLSIIWRGNHSDLRFSVFCTIEYPDVVLPNVILIPQKNIEEIRGVYNDYTKPKQKKRIIKFPKTG